MADEKYKANSTSFSKFLAGDSTVGKVDNIKVPVVDVKNIRTRLNMSQADFAAQFWMTIHSIRNWEQGTRQPDPGTRAYLTVIKNDPVAVLKALQAEVECIRSEADEEAGNRILEYPGKKAELDDYHLVIEADVAAAKTQNEDVDERTSELVSEVFKINTNIGTLDVKCDPITLMLFLELDQPAKHIRIRSETYDLSQVDETEKYEILGLDIGDFERVGSSGTSGPAALEGEIW